VHALAGGCSLGTLTPCLALPAHRLCGDASLSGVKSMCLSSRGLVLLAPGHLFKHLQHTGSVTASLSQLIVDVSSPPMAGLLACILTTLLMLSGLLAGTAPYYLGSPPQCTPPFAKQSPWAYGSAARCSRSSKHGSHTTCCMGGTTTTPTGLGCTSTRSARPVPFGWGGLYMPHHQMR
jgi:hypothetical protein